MKQKPTSHQADFRGQPKAGPREPNRQEPTRQEPGFRGPGFRGPGFRGRHGHIGMVGEKPKDSKTVLKKLLKLLRPLALSFIASLLAAALSTAFSVLAPSILGKTSDFLFNTWKSGETLQWNHFLRLLSWLLLLYVFSSVFTYLQQIIVTKLSQRMVYGLRRDLYAKLNRLPLSYFDGRTHGEILSRISNDVDSISSTLQQSITGLVTALVSVCGVLVMMLLMNPLLTIIALASLPLAGLVTKFIAKHSRGFFKAQQAALGGITGQVEENISAHIVVKAFGQEERSIEAFSNTNNQLASAAWKAQFASGILWPLMNLINNIGYVLVCIFGAILAGKGKMSIGSIQAFLQYLRHFTQPIIQLSQIFNVLQSTLAAAERVFEVLEADEEDNSIQPDATTRATPAHEPKNAKGAVSFSNVSFSYRSDKKLIENLDLDIQPGSVVAIVGPTGAGKTTLVNLLMRFYEINAGSIKIDNRDIRSMSRQDLRRRTGMVLQDSWLFKGSIKDNVAWGREAASEEDILKALQLAHADQFIKTLPEGWNTELNEEADNLSAGQRQLLTIARAILANPDVLILDEATSSVDSRTERQVQAGLEALMRDRTNFVIAHRLSTIRDADIILVMEKGQIVEKGHHTQLLENRGAYYRLYQRQFSALNDN